MNLSNVSVSASVTGVIYNLKCRAAHVVGTAGVEPRRTI